MFRPGRGSGRWLHNTCVCVCRCTGQQGLSVHCFFFPVYGMIKEGQDPSRGEKNDCV